MGDHNAEEEEKHGEDEHGSPEKTGGGFRLSLYLFYDFIIVHAGRPPFVSVGF